jgi:hypothetical protein
VLSLLASKALARSMAEIIISGGKGDLSLVRTPLPLITCTDSTHSKYVLHFNWSETCSVVTRMHLVDGPQIPNATLCLEVA